MPKTNYLLLIVFCVNACTIPTHDFASNESDITGIKLDIGCLIGKPSIELIFLDSLLLFYDPYENKSVTVYDTKNKQLVRRFLSEGQGPGEVVMRPLSLFTSPVEKRICMYQTQISKLNIYEPIDIIENDHIADPTQLQFSGKMKPMSLKKIKHGYVGIGAFEDGRFRMYDSGGNIVSAFGKYPFRGEEMDFMGRFFIYQGFVATSIDGECFAIGSSYCDNLEFYQIVDGTAVLKKKYESYDVMAEFVGNVIRRNDDCIMNYKAAFGGKYCYMLYSGETYLEKGKNTAGGKRIIVFDWNGNYLKSYKAEVEIIAFCVDEENNMIYAIIRDKFDEDGGGFCIAQFNI